MLNLQNSIRSQLPSRIDQSAVSFMKTNLELDRDDLFRSSIKERPNTAQNHSKPRRNLGTTLLEQTLGAPKLYKSIITPTSKTSVRPLKDIEFAMKRLKLWIRQNSYNSQDAFLEVCNQAIGRSRDPKVKISRE